MVIFILLLSAITRLDKNLLNQKDKPEGKVADAVRMMCHTPSGFQKNGGRRNSITRSEYNCSLE